MTPPTVHDLVYVKTNSGRAVEFKGERIVWCERCCSYFYEHWIGASCQGWRFVK